MKVVACLSCGGLHIVGRPVKHKAKYMQRFHVRRYTQWSGRPSTLEPSALATMSEKEAKSFIGTLEKWGGDGDCIVWDYKTGREVCPVKGVDWQENKDKK